MSCVTRWPSIVDPVPATRSGETKSVNIGTYTRIIATKMPGAASGIRIFRVWVHHPAPRSTEASNSAGLMAFIAA